MAKTKNNHYLSQCISINFAEGYQPKTFWEYNPITKELRPKNINRLFAKRRAWGQELESVIADGFENKLGPILKKYAECEIQRGKVLGPKGIHEVQFNGFVIQNESEKSILSKLLCQTLLLQISNASLHGEEEATLSKIFHSQADFSQTLILSLFEVNPRLNCPPLVLLDGMTYIFIVPDNDGKHIGHVGFMFPIPVSMFCSSKNMLMPRFFSSRTVSSRVTVFRAIREMDLVTMWSIFPALQSVSSC